MSQLSVKEHLDGILSDFEALKRSFEMEEVEEAPSCSTRPSANPCPSENGEGKRTRGPMQSTYPSPIGLSNISSPSLSPIPKTRVTNSLSFNRGTIHLPRANGTNLIRVSSFQTRLNPNGFSSPLGPGSNESLHSSSSSLECPTPTRCPPNPARPSESSGMEIAQLSSPLMKKFSSHGNVFRAEGDRPIRQVSKATVNHSSLPSLDLHIAEDQGPSPILCSTSNMDPTNRWSSQDQNFISPLLNNRTLLQKDSPFSAMGVGQLANVTSMASLATKQTAKLPTFPTSLDKFIGNSPVGCVLPSVGDPGLKSLPKAQLQINFGHSLSPELTNKDQVIITHDTSLTTCYGNPPEISETERTGPHPQSDSFQLVSPSPADHSTSQSSFLGSPMTVPTPQGSPASPNPRENCPALIGSISCQDATKASNPELPFGPGEESGDQPLEIFEKKEESAEENSLKEEIHPKLQQLSMEDNLAGEPIPQDGPDLKTTGGGLFGYVGIEAVLDQMRIKTMKTGFEFNIMVVGQSGLGKSTMVNTLFKSKISRKSACSGYEERIPKTVQLLSVTHIVEEKGVKMKLTVTDTPGFGDQINNQNCWEPIIQYINDQYERYLKEEILIKRKQKIPDTRVHACVYFVPPTGHWLRPLDLEFMRRLSKITNVVPVIAKADTLTLEERAEFKQRVQKDLKTHGIHVYPQVDFDDDPDDRLLNDKIREKIPFAVVGADKEHQVNGKKVLGRKTKWGIIEVENSAHCEFPLLRDLLIRSHLQDLKDITHSVHYEQYRIQRLNESNRLAKGGEWLALSSITYEPQGQHGLPCTASAPPPLQ
ncbi:septin-12 isoform X1 [Ahaetulla prasina]|uniref:septin-12 isoform X1 n=2 Tax=Ahaetulla prasina TaxID=499056 RepID=UPI0026487451|nr:septin-12 isoform X1 [Ahaetulla prasina]XP_058013556.1 septin-12 isoform X1 [Ahaetulla prasina]